ncbi:hypothetical protein V0U79_05045 [Hyphobacterium sp. HN65]|uniref:Uncharacterized protein n=1 Tax=Hyphobacterium lacteum TaxID=3116575 RepID=A0ABU7LP86_9PROT|nr:hypothetical protein [Hyphobacterium sp. HN65]MEE2525724.1 hypothetical protein [Hyphobacterium sp. HN65]
MILQNIATAIRQQNYYAVVLEFVIVIAGVVIGFQINAWNEGRQDSAEERDMLVRLYQDIEASLSGQVRDVAYLEQQIADQSIILEALSNCEVRPDDDLIFQRGISTLGWLNPPRLNRRTIDEIMAAGRTHIIRNRAILDELANIVATVEWRASAFDDTMNSMQSNRQRIEPHLRFHLDQVIENRFVPGHRVRVEYDITDLCRNPGLINSVSSVSYLTYERMEAYRPLIGIYEDVLPVIAAELETRWGVSPAEMPE